MTSSEQAPAMDNLASAVAVQDATAAIPVEQSSAGKDQLTGPDGQDPNSKSAAARQTKSVKTKAIKKPELSEQEKEHKKEQKRLKAKQRREQKAKEKKDKMIENNKALPVEAQINTSSSSNPKAVVIDEDKNQTFKTPSSTDKVRQQVLREVDTEMRSTVTTPQRVDNFQNWQRQLGQNLIKRKNRVDAILKRFL